MTTFHFPLERALDWRRTELAMSQALLEKQLAILAEIDRARLELDDMGHRANLEVRQFQPLAGADLGALAEFRERVRARGRDLTAKRLECQKEVALRQAAVVESRRRSRLLEKLKEKRWAEWQAARDRELEELAAESYLAQWARRRASSL